MSTSFGPWQPEMAGTFRNLRGNSAPVFENSVFTEANSELIRIYPAFESVLVEWTHRRTRFNTSSLREDDFAFQQVARLLAGASSLNKQSIIMPFLADVDRTPRQSGKHSRAIAMTENPLILKEYLRICARGFGINIFINSNSLETNKTKQNRILCSNFSP